MNCPNILYPYPLDDLLKTSELSFFDFSDDFVELTAKKKSKDFLLTNITKYAKASDTVLTVNEHLKAKYSYLNKNIHVFKNATNYYNFDRKSYRVIPFLEKLKSKGNPIIGYSGIANVLRIDSNLLDCIAKKRPDWQFVFIGPTNESLIERYLNYKNFQFIPPVDYQSLPDYIHYFDVAIVPFKKNEHTMGNNLLKFHDYLAMGKPVVSTNVGGATDFKDVLMIADGPFDFLLKIEKSLHSDTPADNIKRKNVALENSWQRRIKEVEGLIRDGLHI
jgi:glycosyltransferase involved in cell wall biosynthesis